MSVEINRFIRQLQGVAERHKGSDLFVKCYNETGDLGDPIPDEFDFDNDYSDRLIIIDHHT